LLYLIGEVAEDFGKQGRIGSLIVARPREDGRYQTVIFHTLYPRALKSLDLRE
jgi:hypothetical protein